MCARVKQYTNCGYGEASFSLSEKEVADKQERKGREPCGTWFELGDISRSLLNRYGNRFVCSYRLVYTHMLLALFGENTQKQ